MVSLTVRILYSQRYISQYPLNESLGGFQRPFRGGGEREKPVPLPGIELRLSSTYLTTIIYRPIQE
jgi:hypothetical protein